MSLRSRLMCAVSVVMMATIVLGGAVVIWNGRRQVYIELSAALVVAKASVISDYRLAGDATDPNIVLRHAVAAFDGSRTVRASFIDGNGQVVTTSSPLRPAYPAPRWLVWLLRPSLRAVVLPFGDRDRIVLLPNPLNEMSEVWANISDDTLIMGVFGMLFLAVIWRTIDRIIAPVTSLGRGITELRRGCVQLLQDTSAPQELAAVIKEFNALTRDLAAREGEARELEEQLERLQEEERAELSRNLHDEVGPLLFLAKIDLAAIAARPAVLADPVAGALIESIGTTLATAQQHLRDVLARLRPMRDLEFGLNHAIDTVLARWRVRYPTIAFSVHVDGNDILLEEKSKEAAYRIVTEAVTNAIRHAQPNSIDIRLDMTATAAMEVTVVNDGVAGDSSERPGIGLQGMRERAEAVGGTITVVHDAAGRRWHVRACLPRDPVPASGSMAAA